MHHSGTNPDYKISTSPLSQARLIPSHRTAQTSPMRIAVPNCSSSMPSPGGTDTLTSSTRHRTKTTSFNSGPCTMLVPPALSSRRRSCGGNEERKEAPKWPARRDWWAWRKVSSWGERGEGSETVVRSGMESSGCWWLGEEEDGGGGGLEEEEEGEAMRRR